MAGGDVYVPGLRTANLGLDLREQGTKIGSEIADVLHQLRDDGCDPAHGGQAAQRRGEKNALHQAAVREWNERNGDPPDPREFAEIATQLHRVPIDALESATGLSAHYCSLIRLGKRTPHPRHWSALRQVAHQPSRREG